MALFSDLNYIDTPRGNTLYDLDSLYQAAVSLLQIKKRSVPFKPEVGGNLEKYLFEPCDDVTAFAFLSEINELFKQDSRFQLNFGSSQVIPDPENHQFLIDLIISIPAVGSQSFSIKTLFKQESTG